MKRDRNLLTKEELAAMLGISVPTLYRNLRFGVPRMYKGTKHCDVRQIQDIYIGGKRFWLKDSAKAFLRKEKKVKS